MITTRLRIGSVDNGRILSMEEFHDAEEESGFLYELARGVVEVTQVPGEDHGQIVHNIHEHLSRYGWDHPRMFRRIAHGADIRLLIAELKSDRHPDLAIVFPRARRNAYGLQIPELVVEVVSPGAKARRRDFEQKREEYLALGLREYWIVDPANRRTTVLVRIDGEHGPTWLDREFQGDEPLESALLPGFRARVADFWIDLEGDDGPVELGP